MKLITIEWKKGKVVVPLKAYECECGGVLRDLGSAGCPHDSNYTYFFQCETCKNVHTTEYSIVTSGNPDTQNMIDAGWTRV